MPLHHGQLAGQQRRLGLVTLIADLQESSTFGLHQRRHRPVIDDQGLHLRQFSKFFGVAAVGPGQFQFPKHLRGGDEVGRQAISTGLLPEGSRQKCLPNPGWAYQENVLMAAYPVRVLGQRSNQLLIQSPRRAEVDVFQARVALQTSVSQPALNG